MMTPIAFTEQGNNELSDSDEDSDSIPYDVDDTTTDDATEPYMMSDEDETEKAYVTQSGRNVKQKKPLDYCDL